jgi:hypothetical protein
MSNIGLQFLENTGGESEGLSEAGIETFRDRPFASVARETGQNSRDARLNPAEPVRVTFDVVEMDSENFPSITQFRSAADLCLKKASQKKANEKERGFFLHATNVLQAQTINVLKIADFNTKGAKGPCVEGSPFHTLAKNEGTSTKEDLNSGGSYGIGKNAVFAISDIHTAIFSTCYHDDQGNLQHLCMGKTLFISHQDQQGVERRRKGYWGKVHGYLPLDAINDIPVPFRRSDIGTSIFSIAMRDNRIDWRHEMAVAVIINFFASIVRQEMEFEIDNGNVKINKNTIEYYFNDNAIKNAVTQLNLTTAFDATQKLYACLTDQSTQSVELRIPDLGPVRLHMLLRDGLGYTIGIVRNGMYITDNLAHFDEPFKRFPLHREFSLIIEPTGEQSGEWFKRLEGPKHDDLSAERISDPALRQTGQRAFEKLAKEIRKYIREKAKSEPKSSQTIDELSEFFASDSTKQEDDSGTETDPRQLKAKPVTRLQPKKRRQSTSQNTEDDDPEIVVPLPGTEPAPTPGLGQGKADEGGPGERSPNPRPRGQRAARQVELKDERNLMPDASKPQHRSIIFTSPADGTVLLAVEATGLSTRDRLTILSCSSGSVDHGNLMVQCKKGERKHIQLVLDTPYRGPIDLVAYMQPSEEVAS